MIQQDDEPSSFPVIGVGSDEDAIAVPLLGVVDGDSEQSQRYGVYVRRFYLLFLLSIVSMQQSCVWMTWSPVQSLVQDMYGWSSGTISLMAAWGPIVYIPVCILTTDLVDRLGMRATVTLAALLTFVGTVIRSVTVEAPYAELLAHFGQILNAASGPLIIATPSKLSADWFPPHERTTATSVAVMANGLGSAVGFLVALPITTKKRVKWMLWGEAGLAAVILALCVIDHLFFRGSPPLPPSASAASVKRFKYADWWKVITNPNFTVLAFVYGVSQGTYSGWSGVLSLILNPLGINNNDVNWLGFLSTLVGVVSGVIFGRLGDYIRNYKPVILWLYLFATLVGTWFTLVVNHVIPTSYWQLFLSCGVSSFIINAPAGMFYEAACDMIYPMDEVLAGSGISLWYNAFSGVYILLNIFVPPSAMNWVLTGSFGGCAVMMLLYKERRVRLEVDEQFGSSDAPVGKAREEGEVEGSLGAAGEE